MRTDDPLLTAEEKRQLRLRRRRLIITGASTALLLVLVLVSARPASHAIKRWQARRHAEKAFALIEQENWSEAQKEATAAYQLASSEPQAIRAVARFLSCVRQPQGLEFWDRLEKESALTRDDRREEATLALSLGEAARAAQDIDLLMANDGRAATARDWLLAAQLALQRGAPNESRDALQHVYQDATATTREKLQAAVLGLGLASSAPDQGENSTAEAWSRIEQLAQDQDQAGLDALTLLAQRALSGKAETLKSGKLKLNPKTDDSPTNARSSQPITNHPSPITASALADALDAHPLARAPQHLLSVDLRMKNAPNEKEKLIEGAIARWKDGDNVALVALATWLNGKAEFEHELAAIHLARALQTRELFLQHVDALGGLGRWGEIRQLLESERFPLDPVIAHMYLARCYAQLGQQIAAQNNWQRALEQAASEPGKLMTLADYAEKNGATKIAEQACDITLANAPKLRGAWQMKLRLAQREHVTSDIHDVLAAMLKLWPKDTAVQNDEAYCRLLLNSNSRNVEIRNPKTENSSGGTSVSSGSPSDLRPQTSDLRAIEQIAQRLVEREPSSLPHRTLLALVYLKQNRPATALRVYQKLQVPPTALTPSALAVHAAVLRANGNLEGAAQEASQVPRTALLPEEAELISGL